MNPNATEEGAAAEPITLTDRLTNVLAAPGEAFAGMRNAPMRVSHWLIPLTVACIASAVYLMIAFSQPGVLRAVHEQQELAFKKRVASGAMTAAQAEQAQAMSEQFLTPAVFKAIEAFGGILTAACGVFLMAFCIWLVLKLVTGIWLHYMKVVEVCGLALAIGIIQKIVLSFLVIWKESLLASAGPALLISNLNPGNRLHQFLAALDVMDIWWLAVLSVGVSEVAAIRYRTAAFVTFGVWFGFRFGAMLLTPAQ